MADNQAERTCSAAAKCTLRNGIVVVEVDCEARHCKRRVGRFPGPSEGTEQSTRPVEGEYRLIGTSARSVLICVDSLVKRLPWNVVLNCYEVQKIASAVTVEGDSVCPAVSIGWSDAEVLVSSRDIANLEVATTTRKAGICQTCGISWDLRKTENDSEGLPDNDVVISGDVRGETARTGSDAKLKAPLTILDGSLSTGPPICECNSGQQDEGSNS